MPRIVEVKCDQCGADISSTGNSIDYRIVLASEKLPLRRDVDVITDMMKYRPLERDAYFCRMACLYDWVEPKIAEHRKRVADYAAEREAQKAAKTTGPALVAASPRFPIG